MKIRNGFVSNSSSSSFVVAVRQDATDEDIDKFLEKIDYKISEFWLSNSEYIKNEKGDGIENESDLTEEFRENLRGYRKDGVKLNGWSVNAEHFSSDDSWYPFGSFVYCSLANIQTDTVVIQDSGY